MNVQLPVRMDQKAFLAWAERQEERYELDQGRVIMMTGGSRAHWQITFNLAKALDNRIDAEQFMVVPEFGVDLSSAPFGFPTLLSTCAAERAET